MAKEEKKEPTPEAKSTPAEEAKTLGVSESKINTARYTGKDAAKEAKKHEQLKADRLENRIKKAKANGKMKPIDRRKKLIEAKFRAHKAAPSIQKYSETLLRNLLKELNVIKTAPKQWTSRTANGTRPYPIAEAKKKTALDMIEDMDLD